MKQDNSVNLAKDKNTFIDYIDVQGVSTFSLLWKLTYVLCGHHFGNSILKLDSASISQSVNTSFYYPTIVTSVDTFVLIVY